MTLLAVQNLTKVYTGRDGAFTADKDISFSLESGESVGVLGLSGCGKSTLARMIMGMVMPTSGTVLFRDKPVDWRSEAACKAYYGKVQMVFQDALSSFHPLYTVGRSVTKALENYGVAPAEAAERAAAAFAAVGRAAKDSGPALPGPWPCVRNSSCATRFPAPSTPCPRNS